MPIRFPRAATAGATISALALTLAACSSPAPEAERDPSAEPAARHVHGLALDESSGLLHIATHEGLFTAELPADEASIAQPVAFGDYTGDAMGFLRLGERLLISGHPGSDGGAPNVGVLESDLSGERWSGLSLEGDVDFHAMVAGGDSASSALIAGLDSATGQVFVSPDGGSSWQQGTRLDARSLAWNSEATELFATTAEGLQVSTDDGSDFTLVEGAPPLVLLANSPVGSAEWRIAGIDADGVLQLSTDGRIWTARGQVPFLPEAVGVGEAGAVVIADSTQVMRTTDDGATWVQVAAF